MFEAMAAALKHTSYVYDPIFLKHRQPGHPESPQRLEAILDELRVTSLLAELHHVPARPATQEEVITVHSPEYLERVRTQCLAGGGHLDPDTYTTAESYDVALLAVGSLIDLTLAVLDGQADNGLALLRPPGHHAEPDRPMGFCLLNNVAIAARAAQQQRGLERVAIVDFDVHHGNGTQVAFFSDPSVLYCSTHQYPHYPGTGRLIEIGEGAGAGATVNLPLPAGTGDRWYQNLFSEIVVPIVQRFQPQLLLVSAGYDGHWNDPLAGLGLSLTGITWIVRTLVNLAENTCAGKIVVALEGGYNLDVLKTGVANTARLLSGRADVADPFGPSPLPEPELTGLLGEALKIHALS